MKVVNKDYWLDQLAIVCSLLGDGGTELTGFERLNHLNQYEYFRQNKVVRLEFYKWLFENLTDKWLKTDVLLKLNNQFFSFRNTINEGRLKREILTFFLTEAAKVNKNSEDWTEFLNNIKLNKLKISVEDEIFIQKILTKPLAKTSDNKSKKISFKVTRLKRLYQKKRYLFFVKKAVEFLNEYEDSSYDQWLYIRIRKILVKSSSQARKSEDVTFKDKKYLNEILFLQSITDIHGVLKELFYYPLYPHVTYLVSNFDKKRMAMSHYALLLSGLSQYYLGHYEKASQVWDFAIKEDSAKYSFSLEQIIFYQGLIKLKEKQYQQALAIFEKYLTEKNSKNYFKLQSLYFAVQACKILGEKLKEKKYSEKLIVEYPYTYYGLKLLLSSEDPFVKKPTKPALKISNLKLTSTFKKIVFFHRLGWEYPYQTLLKTEEETIAKKHSLDYFKFLAEKKHWYKLRRLFYKYRGKSFSSWNWYYLKQLFPKPFSSVSVFSEQKNIPESLLYAIIRQESDFRETAKSSAGARGLMQLMPATAKELAHQKNMKAFTLNKLYEPEVNINLGSTYISRLLRAFNGNYLLSFAAYNLGIGKLRSWLQLKQSQDIIDLGPKYNLENEIWIEELPWSETRFYVKAVMRNFLLYELVYGNSYAELRKMFYQDEKTQSEDTQLQ
jgi:hypothetical protein